MIDLRKPLEGVPGLLLMAALIFFGATIGIAVAICFTWIPMSGELANFLGGVVGAGLGAALAVMGAVYVQRRERRDTLSADINLILTRIDELRASFIILDAMSDPAREDGSKILRQLREAHEIVLKNMEETLSSLPNGAALGPNIHSDINLLKRFLGNLVLVSKIFFPEIIECPATEDSSRDYRGLLKEAREITERIAAQVRDY